MVKQQKGTTNRPTKTTTAAISLPSPSPSSNTQNGSNGNNSLTNNQRRTRQICLVLILLLLLFGIFTLTPLTMNYASSSLSSSTFHFNNNNNNANDTSLVAPNNPFSGVGGGGFASYFSSLVSFSSSSSSTSQLADGKGDNDAEDRDGSENIHESDENNSRNAGGGNGNKSNHNGDDDISDADLKFSSKQKKPRKNDNESPTVLKTDDSTSSVGQHQQGGGNQEDKPLSSSSLKDGSATTVGSKNSGAIDVEKGDPTSKKTDDGGSTKPKRNNLGIEYQERTTKRNWKRGEVMPTAEVKKYFRNTLVIMMISPPRYHIVQEVKKHYEPFFSHMFFCGPKNNTGGPEGKGDYGIPIHGYDVVFGNMQYLAVKNILKHYVTNETARAKHEPPAGYEQDESLLNDDHLTGMLYIADDLLLHPWTIAAKNYNRNMPWAVQMGIGHIRSWEKVAAVPMMAMESKFRKSGWPYWRRNHGRLNKVLEDGGPMFRERLAEAARATHPLIYKWSKYNRMNYSMEEAHPYSVFYTIIDTYYIPRSMWKGYIYGAELMANYFIFGECAIATVIRSLHPTFEEMDAQFYWSGGTAAHCTRFKWSVEIDAFHRCRHDHKFAQLMYDPNDAVRQALISNHTFLKEALAINGLAEMPFKPMQSK